MNGLALQTMVNLDEKTDRLLQYAAQFESCAVAFSGGVDSAVVAKAACLALGDRAIAVTGVSPSLADGELDEARRIAHLIGIRHETLATSEFENPDYVANRADRCYHCKTELYDHLGDLCD
ncbi:MAG: TIGR00268 family protein, partial [Pirellulales bacterium]